MKDEAFVWRIAIDERTRIPLHCLYQDYRLEDLQDYHDLLDAFDLQTKELERRAKAKQKRNTHR